MCIRDSAGTATYSSPEITRGVYGEHSDPIHAPNDKKAVLSPNKSEALVMHTTTTPFQVFATPGKSYEVKIKELKKETKLHVSCAYRKEK